MAQDPLDGLTQAILFPLQYEDKNPHLRVF